MEMVRMAMEMGMGSLMGALMAEEYQRGLRTKNPSIVIQKGFSQRAHCRGERNE